MRIRNIFWAFAMLAVLSCSAAGSGKPFGQKKSLPLDGVPNVVLKTQKNSKYLPDRIIVKLSPSVQSSQAPGVFGVASLDAFIQRYHAHSIDRMFPHHTAPSDKKTVDLTKFYVLRYSSPIDAFKVAEELSGLPEVQYAEPWFVYQVSGVAYTPNDTGYHFQWSLAKVKADSAWNITQGDTATVIGIIDTGVQWDHPDLAGNIWINPGESGLDSNGNDKRTNGIDDDGNGYIDDWHGWDFMGADYANPVPDNDARPTTVDLAHGTHVAGIASASTNNVTGIAGMGFKCRILPVKATADNDGPVRGGPYIDKGFEGIVYAADMGAKIINLSWGGYGASQVEQDIINYATNKGSLIVAAAGNSHTQEPEYPASYNNVISVAATTSMDVLATYSNYGPGIDVSAPGGLGINLPQYDIYSTWYPNTYTSISGTSMASPLVAGICALVKSYFPLYSNLQVGEQVRVTCDDISASNTGYPYGFGKGRVNAYKAVTVSSPSIRMTSYIVKDSIGGNNNGSLEPNETFTVGASFLNYLQPTSSGATITLSSSDPYVQIVSGTFPVGTMGTNAIADNFNSPFQVHIKPNVPAGHVASFAVLMTDGSYNDFQVFTLLLNPTFATMNINHVQVSITNNGRIGFNDPFNNTQGVGFVFGGGNHLFEAGLIIGYSSTKLVDIVRDSLGGTDVDFTSSQIYNIQTPGVISAQDGSALFTDNAASLTNKIGLQVNIYSYAFTTALDSDYVLVRYDIKNTSGTSLSNLYAGLFFDWDMLPHYDSNKTAFDSSRALGYAWDNSISVSNPIYCGVRALSGAAGYRGLLNSASIPLGRSAKWSWLSGGIVPMTSTGDIHFAISSGPYSIAANQKQMVAFALLGGKNLANLQGNADAAAAKWTSILPLVDVRDGDHSIPVTYALKQNYPNPFNPTTSISYEIPRASYVVLKVYDVLGREVAALVNGEQQAGTFSVPFDASQLASGVYFYRLTTSEPSQHESVRFVDVKKLILVR